MRGTSAGVWAWSCEVTTGGASSYLQLAQGECCRTSVRQLTWKQSLPSRARCNTATLPSLPRLATRSPAGETATATMGQLCRREEKMTACALGSGSPGRPAPSDCPPSGPDAAASSPGSICAAASASSTCTTPPCPASSHTSRHQRCSRGNNISMRLRSLQTCHPPRVLRHACPCDPCKKSGSRAAYGCEARRTSVPTAMMADS